MKTIKAIFKFLVILIILYLVWGTAYFIIIDIYKDYGPFHTDMNSNGVVTYVDYILRVLVPPGSILLDLINQILISDFGKFFELNTIKGSSRAMGWSGLAFYILLLGAIDRSIWFLRKMFFVEEE
jgi:hypothetical protein